MSTTFSKSMAETLPADLQHRFKSTPDGELSVIELAVSASLPFEEVKDIVSAGKPVKRPNRNRPIHCPPLADELAAWDAAGEEVWNTIE